MRRTVLIIFALATLLPSLAQAYDVLVLQSKHDPAYEEVMKGFRARQDASQRVLVLSDYTETDVVKIVREDHPRLVLALGDAALTAARKVHTIPVLAVMSLGIETPGEPSYNIAGISMLVQPEHYLSLFKKMQLRRVGVIYSTAKSGAYLSKARTAARQADIELVERPVESGRSIISQLQSLTGKVDGLWMLPDTTAVTRESSEAYFRFGQTNRVPVISFASSYLALGAAAVLDIDRTELGRQAATMSDMILVGKLSVTKRFVSPEKFAVRTNPSVMRPLGLTSE